jgi:hypothetical protein
VRFKEKMGEKGTDREREFEMAQICSELGSVMPEATDPVSMI